MLAVSPSCTYGMCSQVRSVWDSSRSRSKCMPPFRMHVQAALSPELLVCTIEILMISRWTCRDTYACIDQHRTIKSSLASEMLCVNSRRPTVWYIRVAKDPYEAQHQLHSLLPRRSRRHVQRRLRCKDVRAAGTPCSSELYRTLVDHAIEPSLQHAMCLEKLSM